jgi:hypothetical protein
MKITKSLLLSLFAGGMLLLSSGSANALLIDFQPHSQDVISGDTVTVDLVISELGVVGTAPSLGAFDISVFFDASILALDTTDADFDWVIDSVVLDPDSQLDVMGLGMNSMFADLTGAGMLNFYDISFDLPYDLVDLQFDSFTLATITFDTIGPGTSLLELTNVVLSDEWGDPLQPDLSNGSITVNPIPEPTAMLLFCTGLAGLAVLRRKKQV